MNKISWWQDERHLLLLSASLLGIDQFLKWVFYVQQPVVDAFIVTFHYVQNTGASFGILQDQNALLIWISIITLGVFMLYYDRLESVYRRWGFVVIAGVLSNLIDRAFRGGVVDYINLGWFPVFNIADMLIVIGIGIVCVIMWREDAKEQSSKKK